MKLIHKKTTPDYLKRFQKEDGIDYGKFRGKKDSSGKKYCFQDGTRDDYRTDKGKVLGKFEQNLLEEQGYLCAYCTNQVPEFEKIKKKRWLKMVVEHWHPESSVFSKSTRLDVNYKNIFACCFGGNHSKGRDKVNDKEFHCDKLKEENFITINPTDNKHIDLLKYAPNGLIYCTNIEDNKTLEDEYNKLLEEKGQSFFYQNGKRTKALISTDLNEKELKLAIEYDIRITLNLNEPFLKKAREAQYKIIQKELTEQFKKKNFHSKEKREFINDRIKYYLEIRDDKNSFEPFCMVKVFVLKERLAGLKGF